MGTGWGRATLSPSSTSKCDACGGRAEIRGRGGGAAHSGCSRRRSGLREAREVANRRRRSPVAGDGNDNGGGVAARPGPRGSVERKEGVEAEPLG